MKNDFSTFTLCMCFISLVMVCGKICGILSIPWLLAFLPLIVVPAIALALIVTCLSIYAILIATGLILSSYYIRKELKNKLKEHAKNIG